MINEIIKIIKGRIYRKSIIFEEFGALRARVMGSEKNKKHIGISELM